MASAPSILYLQLDANYDPVFDPSASLTDSYAVTQAIQTRLRLLLGEWWENLSLGLPVFQLMLGQLGSQQGLSAMTLAVQKNIEGGPFVTSASDVAVTFVDGQLGITAKAQTAFGSVTIASTPGFVNASLGA